MDTKELRTDQIDIGKTIAEGLDALDYEVSSIFWILLPDSGWRLVIATKEFDPRSPSKSYQNLGKKLDKITQSNKSVISRISIVSENHPLVELLRSAIATGPKDISGIRFSNSSINGQLIEDSYIYRMT